MSAVRAFGIFILLSGVGWLCDFASFTLLVKLFDVSGFVANFASSYVGVTFVWFTSLNIVFGRMGAARGRFLAVYWIFQFVSILLYSQALQLVFREFRFFWASLDLLGVSAVLFVKIAITPFNLTTNFLFMKWLTRFMHQTLPVQS